MLTSGIVYDFALALQTGAAKTAQHAAKTHANAINKMYRGLLQEPARFVACAPAKVLKLVQFIKNRPLRIVFSGFMIL